jgi:hypothetical protein
VHRQLTISAADIEAPILPDQQPLHQSPSPLQGLRSVSSPAAAAAAALSPLLLPAVTLMFVSVDGSKVLRKHHVRDVHCQLSLMFMEALRHVPGGYMCRMQVWATARTSLPAGTVGDCQCLYKLPVLPLAWPACDTASQHGHCVIKQCVSY